MGRSQSGKTTMAVKIVEHLLPSVDKLVICSPTFDLQPTWKNLKNRVDLYSDSLPNLCNVLLKYLNSLEGKSCLLVLDDVSGERSLNEGSRGVLNRIAYNAVWMKVSTVIICHRLSNIGSGVRENIEHLLLFQTINSKQEKDISDNFNVIGDKKAFLGLYNEVVTKPIMSRTNLHPFLYICFKDGVRIYDGFSTQLVIT